MPSNLGGGRGSYVYTNKGGKQQARGQESPPSAARPTYIYNPATRRAAPTPYAPPPLSRGYRGKGPSGRQVYHTRGAWKAIQAAQKAKPAPTSPIILAARLALLHALSSPKAARQAGETLSQASAVGKQVFQQEGKALALRPRNVGKPSGLAAVPGDVLGAGTKAVKEAGDALNKLGSAIANPTGPLGSSGQGLKRVKTAASLVNQGANATGVSALGKAIANPGGPLASTGMGSKRIDNAVARSSEAANTAVSALRAAGITKQVQGQVKIKAPGAAGKAQTEGLSLGAGGGKLAENALKNVVEFPAASVSSAYQLATKPGQTIKAYGKTGFLPAVASGNLGEAAKRFEKNPLFSLAEVRGAAAIPGRAAGSVARNVPGAAFKEKPTVVSDTRGTRAKPGVPNTAGRIRQIGSTKRAPLKLTPGQHVTRHYSPDLIVKAAQVASDRAKARKGLDPNQATGRRLTRALKARANQQTELAEVSRRQVRAKEQQAATAPQTPTRRAVAKGRITSTLPLVKARPPQQGIVPPEYADGLVHAIAERRIRSEKTFVADAKAELARLRAEQKSVTGPQLKENRRNVKSLDQALKDPNLKQHIPALMKAGNETATVTRAHGEELAAQGIYDPEQIRRSRLFPYAVTHMAAKYNRDAGRLEVPVKTLMSAKKTTQTRPVESAEIEAHMKANGVEPPGFISHNPSRGGAREYYQASKMTRGGGSKARRTGEATRKGTMSTAYQSIVDQRVGGAGKVEQAKQFDRMVNEMTNRPPEKGGRATTFKTPKDAEDAIWNLRHDSHGNEIPGAPQYRVVNMRPRAISQTQREAIMGHQAASASMAHIDKIPGQKAIRASVETGPGEYRIMPEAQFKTITEQARGRNTAERAVGAVTQQFRGTVLPFSLKWFTGNIAEEYGVRMPSYAIGPHSMHVGSHILNALEKKDAEQFAAITHQGRLYGSTPRMMTHTAAEQFQGTNLEGPANALAILRRTPAVKQVVNGLVRYQRAAFKFNSKIEGGGELGAIGKIARKHASELGDFGQSWLKTATMGKKLADEVAGKIAEDPNLKFEFAAGVDEILGKYSGYSAGMRHIIQTYAPFLPWYLNAARFIYWTLPVKHPIKTAVLAGAETALQKDWEQSHLPESLRGTIKTPGGGLLDVTRYTPAGAFVDPSNLSGTVLPQIGSLVSGFKGQDFTDREIKVPTGKVGPRGGKQTRSLTNAEKLQQGAYGQLESVIPGLRIIRQIEEHGETPLPTSTVLSPKTKPGTDAGPLKLGPVKLPSAANRILNPVRPIHLGKGKKKTKVKKKDSGSYGGGPNPYPSGGAYGGGSSNPY